MKRLIYGWTLFFIAIVAIMVGGVFFAVLLGAACYIGGQEFIAIARAKGFRPSAE